MCGIIDAHGFTMPKCVRRRYLKSPGLYVLGVWKSGSKPLHSERKPGGLSRYANGQALSDYFSAHASFPWLISQICDAESFVMNTSFITPGYRCINRLTSEKK
jgi:hypothetical protein